MQQLDRRVWYPDETCVPCHIEIYCAGSDLYLGQFTVPRGMVCVFTSIHTAQINAQIKATGGAVNIIRGKRDGALAADVANSAVWSGGLADVYELNNAGAGFSTGIRCPGFVVGSFAMSRPCRLILESDVWQIISGPVTVASNAMVIFDGYLFPDKANATTTQE